MPETIRQERAGSQRALMIVKSYAGHEDDPFATVGSILRDLADLWAENIGTPSFRHRAGIAADMAAHRDR